MVTRYGCRVCGGSGALGPDWDEYVCPWCQGGDLANFAGLTDEQSAAIGQRCYDEEQKRRQGIVLCEGDLNRLTQNR